MTAPELPDFAGDARRAGEQPASDGAPDAAVHPDVAGSGVAGAPGPADLADPSDPAASTPSDPADDAHSSVLVSAMAGLIELITPRSLLFITAVAIIAGSWALGGFGTIEAVNRDLPVIGAGKTASAPPLEVVVNRARVLDADPSLSLTDIPGEHYVVVTATLTTTDPQPLPAYDLDRLFTPELTGLTRFGTPVPDTEKGHAPQVLRPDGQGAVDFLQPDLPQPVLLIWEQQDSQPVPAELRISVSSLTWRASSLSGEEMYLDPTPAVIATAPVEDSRTGDSS